MTSTHPYVDGLKQAHFAPLCRDLGLVQRGSDVAESGNVAIFFEEERGLCSLGIGAVGSAEPLCGVEALATRFPRQREMAEGYQRLSLSEQGDFVRTRWNDLQVMFSAEHLRETVAWHRARSQAITDSYAKRT
jgi:hypothetical protein